MQKCTGFSNDLYLFNRCDQLMVSESFFCTKTSWHRKDCLLQCEKTGREVPRCARCKEEVKNIRRTAERMAQRCEIHKKVTQSYPTKETITTDLMKLYNTSIDLEEQDKETTKLFQLAHTLQIDIGEVFLNNKKILYACPYIEFIDIGLGNVETKTLFCNYPQTAKHTILNGVQLKHKSCPSFIIYTGTNTKRKFCRQCYLLLRAIKVSVLRENEIQNISNSTIPNYTLTRRELELKCAQQHADLVKAKQLFNESLN